jgi:aminoglycoside 6'-N-acetyltransferase
VAGIDYLIGEPAHRGRGLGAQMIGALCELAFDRYPDVDGIAAVPQATNSASRRALEHNGFRLVEVRMVESDDPGDAGLAAIYLLERRR